jgi:hypothetical protein
MSVRSALLLASVFAFAIVVLVSSLPVASAANGQSPCKLATATEVKAAFGGTIGAGKLDNTIPGAPTCRYNIKGSNLGRSGTAVVFVTPGQTAATFALAKKVVPGVISVSGVGNGAFYNPNTTSVEFIKGATVANAQGIFLSLGGPSVNAAKVKADVIALAKSVAKHV